MCHVPVTCQCRESRTTYLHYTLAGALTQRSSRFQCAIPLCLFVLPAVASVEAGGCLKHSVPGNSTVATGVDICEDATTAAGASSAMAPSIRPSPRTFMTSTTGTVDGASAVGGSFRFRPGGIVPSRLQKCTCRNGPTASVRFACRNEPDLQSCAGLPTLQVPVLTILLIKSVPAEMYL